MINREIKRILTDRFFKGKIILLLGPRQVGKTTLARTIVKEAGQDYIWLDGDEPDVRAMFSNANSSRLKSIVGNKKVVVIDEAQRISDIGINLKLLIDNMPEVQFVVTGSSALELKDELKEPLTGRKYEYQLYPLSFSEMVAQSGLMDELRLVEHRMLYGYYPEVVTKKGEEREILKLLSESYLYKDILKMGLVKKPPVLEKIVQALALQLGSEVSFAELAQLTGVDNTTVERYIDLLEKAFVIFRLPSLSRNVRNEIKKGRKIYFYDNGIRNAIIKNFAPLDLRNDVGALWENFLISERLKNNQIESRWVNRFFWRTHSQQEIDYVEESDGLIRAYEFKWNPKKKARIPKTFMKAYPNSTVEVITRDNFESFISTI